VASIRQRNGRRSSRGNGASLDKDRTTMTERPPTTTADGFSLVTGPGRAPLTWREVNALGRVLGTVPAPTRFG
jgi:hypothetical protein